MNIFKAIPFFILFIITSLFCSAQSITITGNVQDAHTKEPVGFASAYLQISGIGKTTDSIGNFSFSVNQLQADTLVISYVGYQALKVPLLNVHADTSFLLLLQRGVSTNNVSIKAKINKGLFLWRKIMSKKKEYNRYGLDNFGYKAYNKLEIDIKNFKPDKLKKNFILKPFDFVFDNIDSVSEKDPFLPAYLVESLSDYEYQNKPKRYYENIIATSTKGFKNESISKLLGVMNQNVNIYGNYINVMDKDFISPFNENGDNYYNFNVADTQVINGNKTFHFIFSPKHSGQNTFEGDAWVMAKTFHLQKVTLYLGKGANINYIDRISVYQEFEPVNDSLYFIKKDKFFADFKVLGKKSLTLIGRKTTLYKDIVVNNDSIASHLKDQQVEEITTTGADINNNTNESWDSLRFEPLTKNENSIYTTLDKLLVMPKFQKLQNAITFIGTGYKNIGNYEIGPWFNWISSNAWEGTRFRFDLGTNMGFNKKMYLHGYLAYGTKDKKVKGKAEAFG
ncbi:MAG: carboxypeptidase-like regulatory domain-containing protein [Chitinophagaceae bacterium]|nr:carboxypeptidase-like regulatory domain-containing protein [Chitinophagaceae bacterium]